VEPLAMRKIFKPKKKRTGGCTGETPDRKEAEKKGVGQPRPWKKKKKAPGKKGGNAP